MAFSYSDVYNRNRNLQTSKAPLENQVQATSLFTSVCVYRNMCDTKINSFERRSNYIWPKSGSNRKEPTHQTFFVLDECIIDLIVQIDLKLIYFFSAKTMSTAVLEINAEIEYKPVKKFRLQMRCRSCNSAICQLN